MRWGILGQHLPTCTALKKPVCPLLTKSLERMLVAMINKNGIRGQRDLSLVSLGMTNRTSILENGKGGSGDGDALACDLNLFVGKSKNFLDSKYKRQISPVKRLF